MRIAIVGAYPADPGRMEGGIHSVVAYLVEGLRQESGAEIHVVTGVCPGESTEVRQVRGAWVHPFVWPRFGRLTFHRRAVARMIQVLREIAPDVVHGQGPAASYALAAMKSGFPYVVTWHAAMFREAAVVPGLVPHLVYALDILYERYCWRRMREVIAISPYVEREYRAMTQARFHLIENPIVDPFFEIEGEGEEDRVFCAARIIPRKDVLTLLQAFALLLRDRPQAQLRIAGEMTTDPAYARQCQDFVAQNGLAGSVRFLGHLGEAEILEEYRRCSLVALSSRQETAPMMVAQAMAAGRAVVATPVGGTPWLVEHGITGLLSPCCDPRRMALALRRLLEDRSLRRWMGQRGHEQAERRFRTSAVARRTLEVYQKLIQ
ncbi:MAG: glycosyltransferase family 4 protein [Anaerolineae bacterium]